MGVQPPNEGAQEGDWMQWVNSLNEGVTHTFNKCMNIIRIFPRGGTRYARQDNQKMIIFGKCKIHDSTYYLYVQIIQNTGLYL